MKEISKNIRSSDFIIAMIAVIVTVTFFFLHKVGLSDLFWQIKIGEIISKQSQILYVDPFSYATFGKLWVNHEWLASVVFYAVESIGGFSALSVLSLIIGLMTGLILFFGLAVQSKRTDWALLLTFIIFAIGAPRFQQLRPELFGFMAFAIYLILLSSPGRLDVGRLWLLVPLQILWANVHASAILGPGVIILYTLVASQFGRGGEPISRDEKRVLLLFSFLSIVVSAINPFYLRFFIFPFEHLSHSFALAITADWRTNSLMGRYVDLAPWGLLLIAVGSLFMMKLRRAVINWPLVAIAAIFIVPGMIMERFAPFAAIAISFLLASLIGGGQGYIKIKSFSIMRLFALIICVALPILMFSMGPIYGVMMKQKGINLVMGRAVGVGLDSSEFPVEAMDFLEAHPEIGNIFNDMAYGGYMIYRLWPERRVFFDTRTPLYGEDFYMQYVGALYDENRFKILSSEYLIDAVLYDPRHMVGEHGALKFLINDPDWAPVFKSDNAIILVRTKPRPNYKNNQQ
jgi:hypothetical protein